VGAGASYDIYTFNIGVPIPAQLDPRENSGSTKSLHIQSSIYTNKIIVDLFGQFYKGMYLQNTSTYSTSSLNSYYVRPDIYTQLIGFSAYYIFNHKKFSFRAGLIQNQRQKKSAGSLLLGLETYHGLARGDSAFIPAFAISDKNGNDAVIDRFSFFRIGPGVGYAHTFVLSKNFFVMLSLTGNVALGNYQESRSEGLKVLDFTVDPGLFFRSAIGYNQDQWFFGASFVNNAIINLNLNSSFSSMFAIGNNRIIIARRFDLSKKTKKSIDKFLPKVN
jgi:hypothetical protein